MTIKATTATKRKPASGTRAHKTKEAKGKSETAEARAKPAASGTKPTKPPAKPVKNKTEQVDAFMAQLEHPFKAEVEAVRKIIKSVNNEITEEIKWAAPSFSYKGYMVTFNLWAKQHVHLVFHNGAILSNKNGLLEGDYVDRRMMYFKDMKAVKAKKAALVQFVQEWCTLMDKQNAA